MPLAQLRAILALIGALAVASAGWWLHHTGYEAGAAEVQAKWDKAQAERIEATLARTQADRSEEQRRTDEQRKAINDAHAQTTAAQTDAARLRSDLYSLRSYTCKPALGGAATGNPSVVGPGAPASAADTLPADVLARLGEAAGVLAEYADASRIAGTACQRSYESLTK